LLSFDAFASLPLLSCLLLIGSASFCFIA
jgi:hypothetical protein